MKNLFLLTTCVLLTAFSIQSQSFSNVSYPFENIKNGDVAFADVDGDSDDDILIAGNSQSNVKVIKLYINNGNGDYTEDTTIPFPPVSDSAIAFEDIDGDTDLDLLITGNAASGDIAKLYTNDGNGNFTEVTGTPFPGVSKSSLDFADVNGDTYIDVLINIPNSSGSTPSSKLYLNDGSGNFTEASSNPFVGLELGSVSFGDVNGDLSPDVLISGFTTIGDPFSRLYINDGNGNFTGDTSVPFSGYGRGYYSQLLDIDGDTDNDVILARILPGILLPPALYKNNGNGVFTEVTATPFLGTLHGKFYAEDVDGDNDLDIVTTGQTALGANSSHIPKLFINDGTGNYTEQEHAFIYGNPSNEYNGLIGGFSDLDGDSDKDFLLTHQSDIHTVHTNIGNGVFTNFVEQFRETFRIEHTKIADVDGDNDIDMLVYSNVSGHSILYTNDGFGAYTRKVDFEDISNIQFAEFAFSDVNGNSFQDLIILDKFLANHKLYINDGLGNYTEDTNFTLADLSTYSSITVEDVDGDLDNDFITTGYDYATNPITSLYINDGNGSFTKATTSIVNVTFGATAFADIDGDTDKDLIISGFNSGFTTKLYTNNAGVFTEVTGAPFQDMHGGTIVFEDIDGDLDNDVVLSGKTSSGDSTKLYTNNGSGVFTEVAISLVGVNDPSIHFADIDGDMDADLFISGELSFVPTMRLYKNEGASNFTEVSGLNFDTFSARSTSNVFDANGDDIPDVFYGGDEFNGKIYINTTEQEDGETLGDIGFSEQKSPKLFPNPTNSTLTIYGLTQQETAQIYTITGQKLFTTQLNQSQNKLDVSKLNTGIYFIKINDATLKFIKN